MPRLLVRAQPASIWASTSLRMPPARKYSSSASASILTVIERRGCAVVGHRVDRRGLTGRDAAGEAADREPRVL